MASQDDRIGRSVTVVGTALDGRAGALVEADDGRWYYISALEAWDAELAMQRVSVTGVLRLRPATVPRVPADEEQRTGLPGDTLVLDDASWSLAEASTSPD